MNRTVYIAPNLAYVENHLGRKLHPSESFAHDRDDLRGLGKGTTFHFLGFWQRGYEHPQRVETEARIRQMAGATIINAPWVQP